MTMQLLVWVQAGLEVEAKACVAEQRAVERAT